MIAARYSSFSALSDPWETFWWRHMLKGYPETMERRTVGKMLTSRYPEANRYKQTSDWFRIIENQEYMIINVKSALHDALFLRTFLTL